MQCPIDGTDLAMAERHGVEIDYCPKCRGVWLDRGELDKIIEQAEGGYDERRRHGGDYEEGREGRGGRRRRRFSEFFEMGD